MAASWTRSRLEVDSMNDFGIGATSSEGDVGQKGGGRALDGRFHPSSIRDCSTDIMYT